MIHVVLERHRARRRKREGEQCEAEAPAGLLKRESCVFKGTTVGLTGCFAAHMHSLTHTHMYTYVYNTPFIWYPLLK